MPQDVQVAAPALEYVPASQSVGVMWSLHWVPAGHGVHAIELAAEYSPAGHVTGDDVASEQCEPFHMKIM